MTAKTRKAAAARPLLHLSPADIEAVRATIEHAAIPQKKVTLGNLISTGVGLCSIIAVCISIGSFKATAESFQAEMRNVVTDLTGKVSALAVRQSSFDSTGSLTSLQVQSLDRRVAKVEDVLPIVTAMSGDVRRVLDDVREMKDDLKRKPR